MSQHGVGIVSFSCLAAEGKSRYSSGPAMTSQSTRCRGFTLLELIMAMALFAMAAVSLAEALNLISVTVSESIEEAELRERLRGMVMEVTRDPNLAADTRETNPDEKGYFFKIETIRLENLINAEGQSLDNLFEVKVTAMRETGGGRSEALDTVTTVTYPGLF